MERFLVIELENGGKIYEPIDYIPQHWGEKEVLREFEEFLLLEALLGEESVGLSNGVEVPIVQIEDVYVVEN